MRKFYFTTAVAIAMALSANAQNYEVADFEDIEIGEEGHMSVSTEEDDDRTSFQSGGFEFATGCMSDWGYWYWFGYANQTDNTYATLDDQWKNVVGGGYDGSANYGVAYAAAFNGPCYATVLGDEVAEVNYITNSAYAYASMTTGDDFAKKFGQGDWFKLTITGYDVDGEVTDTKDYYLADLRDEDASKHYIINDWRYVDLSALGKVKKIGFELSSSDGGEWGMNTPAYFCFDNFGAEGEEVLPEGNVDVHVSSVKADATPIERFDLQGRKIGNRQRGLNIIRQTDGSVRKVVVK